MAIMRGISRKLSVPFFAALFITVVLALLYAVTRAGYHYMFDNDEVSHAQIAYLLARGYAPYRDFFSVYPLLFDRMLLAVFSLTGFTFDAMFAARGVMVVMFLLRILGAAALTFTLFGSTAALVFIPLALIDPFTVFSGMQIRPDNLMVLFFIYAVLLFLWGARRRNTVLLILSGTLTALSFLTLPKILPSVLPFTALALWFLMKSGNLRLPGAFLAGIFLTSFIYVFPFAADGTLDEMFRQTVLDARETNNALLYPVKLGSFYYADNNVYLYGHPGKPLTWMYVWTLPLLAFAGLYQTLKGYVGKKHRDTRDGIRVALVLALILQWTSLFFIHSVFLQYYIPITWLFALFAAALISDTASYPVSAALRTAAWFIGAAFFAAITYTQVTGNLNRAMYDNSANRKYFKAAWRIVGENEETFPNALFRPLAYPLPYGYFYADIPPGIISRYPDLITVIENRKLRILFIDDYFMGKLPEHYQTYILSHYTKEAAPLPHFVRNP